MVRSKIATSVKSGMEGEVREGFCRRGGDRPGFEKTSQHWVDPSTSQAEWPSGSVPGQTWVVSGSTESEFIGCLQRAPEIRSHQVHMSQEATWDRSNNLKLKSSGA